MTAAGRQDATGGASALQVFTLVSATSLSIQVTGAVSGWIFTNPFTITIDANTPSEEKMYCSAFAGTDPSTITVISRGYDDTVPTTHGVGATVTHTFPSTIVMDVERHIYATSEDDHTQYLTSARHGVPASHEFGTPGSSFAFGAGTTVPSAISTSANAGAGASPARDDHVHVLGAGSVNAFTVFGSAVVGAVGSIQSVGGSASAGTATTFARTDHVHDVDDASIPAAKVVFDPGPLVNAHTGISTMTYAQREALTGTDLWAGRQVFQTDSGTNRTTGLWTWIDATVGWRLPWNQPWGQLAYAENASFTQNIGGVTYQTIGSLTVTAVVPANRVIQVSSRIPLVVQNVGNSIVKIGLFDGSGTNQGLIIDEVLAPDPAPASRTSGEGTIPILGLSGSVTFTPRGLTSTNTMSFTAAAGDPGKAWIRISDGGPNGDPA